MKLKNRYKNKVGLSIPILAIMYLGVLLYLKYHFNQVSLSQFKVNYIGNILNLLVTFLLIVGLMVVNFSNKPVSQKNKTILLLTLILSISFLIFAFMINNLGIVQSERYFLNTPIKKIYVGILMISSFFLHIYSLVYIWGLLFGSESLFELRTLVRSILIVLILMIFTIFFVWNVKAFSESNIENKKFEFGCIPGAAVWSKGKPSPIFEMRIRKAFELNQKEIIRKLILTGGNAPGEITEAEAAFKYLKNLGIDRKQVTIETKSSTTTEQIKYLSEQKRFHASKEPVLIISDGFHLSRIMQISIFYNIKTMGVSSDYTLSFEKTIFYRTRESVALLLFWLLGI